MKLMGICLTASVLLKLYLAMDLDTQIEVIWSVSQYYHARCVFILTSNLADLGEYDSSNFNYFHYHFGCVFMIPPEISGDLGKCDSK